MEQIKSFKIIGIETRTINAGGQATTAMSGLWYRFFNENIIRKIPNIISENIYCIYTDYETDYRGPYTAIIGMQVDSLENIPQGLTGREFPGGKYEKYLATGEMPGAVMYIWNEIWDRDKVLNRKYTADFEVYGEKSQRGDASEVEIYIAIK